MFQLHPWGSVDQNSIPFHCRITFYWLWWTMLLWTFMFNCLYGHIFLFAWVYFLDHMATRRLIFSGTTRSFFKTAAPFHMFPSNVGGPNVFTSLLILLISWLFDLNHPNDHEVVFHCRFNLHFFLMTNNVKGCVYVHMYMCSEGRGSIHFFLVPYTS